ncbi:Dihydroneopterin aldolase [gamma proteobacterium IMCC1989]|nr:Dihydroneopterin aldolase [gamma proteobacterium IMCC1989]
MDKVIIRDLALETIVGLYPWERAVKQTLLIDVDMATDIRQAAADDDLQYTVDYSAVCEAIVVLADKGQYQLIETLAENIAATVLKNFAVSWLRVAVYKTDVMTHVGRVGIEIERGEK